MWKEFAAVLVGALAAVTLFVLSLFPYGRFAGGDYDFFNLLLIKFPLACFATALGGGGLLQAIVKYDQECPRLLALIWSVFLLAVGPPYLIAESHRLIHLGIPRFQLQDGGNWLPYLFAASTVIPIAIGASLTAGLFELMTTNNLA